MFDGASRHNGVSLNDIILDCPKLQSELFDILLRFRRYAVAIACDIAMMYLQIRIPVSDRPHFRFLWKVGDKITAYEFEGLCFGQSAAPAQAIFVSQENALAHQSEYIRVLQRQS